MARNKYRRRKTNNEVKRYKNSLGENSVSIESTYEQDTSMLVGSDSFRREPNLTGGFKGKEPVANKPWNLVILDWLKNNAAGIIVTAIALPVLGWMIGSIIDIQKGRAVSEYRIEKLEQNLDSLLKEIPNEDNLRLEIKNLKEDVDELELDELEKRINKLEIIIENNQ